MRIALLFHERDQSRDLSRYDILHIAKYWQRDGHDVIPVFGHRKFVSADIAILHVDLSLVPQGYVDLANRYPLCLNKNALDIRKSRISENLLKHGDDYDGPVIIKSNENTAGIPERINAGWRARLGIGYERLMQGLGAQPIIRKQADYRIVENLSLVHKGIFDREDLVVEKFLPERIDGFFCTRTYLFLGDGEACQLNFSPDPIVSWANTVRTETCDIAPQAAQWRRELGFDYGKFDYVIHQNKAILLDANKTTGSGGSVGDALVETDRQKQAGGLMRYYETHSPNVARPSR